LYASLPALAGIVFAFALCIYGTDWYPYGWHDISNWRGTVYGIKPGSNLANLKMSPEAKIQTGADLSNVDFEDANLEGVTLEQLNLRGANLAHVDARNANFGHSNLESANLTYANLAGASFQGSILRNASFGNANLPLLSSFEGVDWHGVTLNGATADIGLCVFAKLNGAKLDATQEQAANAWLALHVHSPADTTFDSIVKATAGVGSSSEVNSNADVLRRYERERSTTLYEHSLY
jgi:hypothetical protein